MRPKDALFVSHLWCTLCKFVNSKLQQFTNRKPNQSSKSKSRKPIRKSSWKPRKKWRLTFTQAEFTYNDSPTARHKYVCF